MQPNLFSFQFEREGCVGQISRSLPLGGEIITLSAIDFDANNMISYRLVAGNADGCFHLDETTGVIRSKCDLALLPVKRKVLNVTATDGQHFADVMPIQLNFLDSVSNPYSGGGSRYNGNNKKMADFTCQSTDVAHQLTRLLALAERNNRYSAEDAGPDPVLYQNIHAPKFSRLPKSIFLNETAPIGSVVFKVRFFFQTYDSNLIICQKCR